MKRIISLLLVAVLFVMPLNITASAAEVSEAQSTSVQPRLNETITRSLGNAWTTFWDEDNLFIANLDVTNTGNSSYSVKIRIVSKKTGLVISDEKTLKPGEYAHFSGIPGGGYYIQGKTLDGNAHTYEFKLEDQF